MRFATLKNGSAIVIVDAGYTTLESLGFTGSLREFIRIGNPGRQRVLNKLTDATFAALPGNSDFSAPITDPGKIIAIGLNYIDHAAESKMEVPKSPLVFTKFSSSITGPADPVRIPVEITSRVDYEVELGVVIGEKTRDIPVGSALESVFGYTVINDVSARDLQFADGQWVRGKSLDTFCPMGPVIVPAGEIADPQNLDISCEVNGQILQQASTKDMIFGVATLISELSKWCTLEPGDIIATGTPSGVGFSRTPPIYLKPGDTMRTRIEGIGELNNRILAL
ncbi:MAG: FAA hydrolase family protein [Balneolaceae bacterium]|nr:MAG: FAA hydrolase family protein [Balneolaceae bacterium]